MTKSELIENANKAVRKAETERDTIVTAVSSLPDGVDFSRVHVHTYKADLTVVFEDKTPDEAFALLSTFEPFADLIRYKDGCLSFFPESRQTDRERANEHAEIINTAPILIEFENYSGPRVELNWWSVLPSGQLAKIEVRLSEPHRYIPRWEWSITRDARGREIDRRERFESIWGERFEGAIQTDRFASGDNRKTFGKKVQWFYFGDDSVDPIRAAFLQSDDGDEAAA